jgi:hypothetical protein
LLIPQTTLWKQLVQEGYLLPGNGRYTIHKRVEGSRANVRAFAREKYFHSSCHAPRGTIRKTDRADARRLAKRMRHGLRQASVIPAAAQRDLRDLTRDRTKLVQEWTREVNRVPGVLERANITWASGASDSMGVSGRAILAALIEGRADPTAMAELAKGRLRTKMAVLVCPEPVSRWASLKLGMIASKATATNCWMI